MKEIKKKIYRLMGRGYLREGSCNQCGACCNFILLLNQGSPVKSEEEFNQLKEVFPEYDRFYIRGFDKDGHLLFTCRYLSPQGQCGDYKARPLICREYPNEGLLRKGGILVSKCGYRFEPVLDFEKMLNKAIKKDSLNVEEEDINVKGLQEE